MVHIALSGNPLDRAHHRRLDSAWLREARASHNARLVVFCGGKPIIKNGEAVILSNESPLVHDGAAEPLLFLGLDDSTPYFAIELPADAAPQASALGDLADFRMAMGSVPAAQAAILGEARGLLNWHARHRFCANCGAPSDVAEGGWKRDCASCKAEHFPRTDPVVIMLATRGDYALMGRQGMFPASMFSALAGFMEPGETIEEAVAREVKEEAGIAVGAVRYIASQPWPFPSSLMIGCLADALTETIHVDKTELEEARWFSRAEIKAALPRKFGEGPLSVPPPFAIAHQLMKYWLEH